jgi:hypothetical protein
LILCGRGNCRMYKSCNQKNSDQCPGRRPHRMLPGGVLGTLFKMDWKWAHVLL